CAGRRLGSRQYRHATRRAHSEFRREPRHARLPRTRAKLRRAARCPGLAELPAEFRASVSRQPREPARARAGELGLRLRRAEFEQRRRHEQRFARLDGDTGIEWRAWKLERNVGIEQRRDLEQRRLDPAFAASSSRRPRLARLVASRNNRVAQSTALSAEAISL